MKIEKLHITNFRSLKDLKVDEFAKTTIFYGENNAGKSNILKALDIIFQRKAQSISGEEDFTAPKNFYEGIIKDFSNNFYNNNNQLIIDFSIEITVEKSKIEIKDSIQGLFNPWPENLNFSIQGNIIKSNLGNDFAEMQTSKISVNDIVIYEVRSRSIKYFESLLLGDQTNASVLSDAFTHFVDPLNDCVYVIGSTRDARPTQFDNKILDTFDPHDFKKSLYSLYLNEKKHNIFEEIDRVFSSYPFSFGNISFSLINNELEIMIKNNGIRLPIKHLGSGVEQILFIVASLIYTSNKIICIEELEQNLSPKLQNLALRKLQSMLGSYLDQIIISSHSSVFAKHKLSEAIYLIEKGRSGTIITEKLSTKYGKKAKDHFIDAAPPYDTYTDEELKARTEEINEMTERRFRM